MKHSQVCICGVGRNTVSILELIRKIAFLYHGKFQDETKFKFWNSFAKWNTSKMFNFDLKVLFWLCFNFYNLWWCNKSQNDWTIMKCLELIEMKHFDNFPLKILMKLTHLICFLTENFAEQFSISSIQSITFWAQEPG